MRSFLLSGRPDPRTTCASGRVLPASRRRTIRVRARSLLVAGILAGATALSAGSAHAATLSGSLADAAGDARLLAVDCANDGGGAPASLTIAVRDLAPANAPIVSAQIHKGFAAKSASDAVDADAGTSPVVSVDGGAGRYDVYVDKNAVGAESFEVTAQCWTGPGGTGSPTGTTLFDTAGGPVPTLDASGVLVLLLTLVATGFALLRMARARSMTTLSVTLLAIGLGLSGARGAFAHDQSGSLGAAASATDLYEVTCFDNGPGAPASLEISILDASPGAAPNLNAQVHRGLSLANASDDVAADALPSPEVFVNEGAGVYVVLVDKSGAGAKFYTLSYHCWTGPDGTGVHTGTALVTRQSE